MKDFFQQFFQELFKATPILLIVLGVILLLLGLGVSVGAFSIEIKESGGQIIVILIGLIFVVTGMFLIWKEKSQPQEETRIEVKKIENIEELYKYAKKRIEKAKAQIDDTTWGEVRDENRTEIDNAAYEDYLEMVISVCKKGTISYREIMGFHPVRNISERIKIAERRLKQNLFSYHLKYVEYPLDKFPSLMSFLIVDTDEVILAFYRVEGKESAHLAIRSPLIVKLFKEYYEELWDFAKWIKRGDTIYWENFEALKERLK